MVQKLLKTKLEIPLKHSKRVSRLRLVKKLSSSQKHRLTLLSAPAGFGKTTALCDWLHISKVQAGWLSLDEGDNDPGKFWAYVIRALQMVNPDIGQPANELLFSIPRQPLKAVITSLLNEISEDSTSYSLILDDYHLIENKRIHKGIAFLIDYLPPNMNITLSTRTIPPIHISRLRVRGRLNEVNALDLKFSVPETFLFFKDVMGLTLSKTDMKKLEAVTEGWVAGLQMSALAIRQKDDIDRFLSSFQGRHNYISTYLLEEVFRLQPDTVQQFLLKTSILDQLSASLCDAVVQGGDSADILDNLDRDNLFLIPLDDEKMWYRYHNLFKGFLLERTRRLHPDLVAGFHHRAWIWYAANGFENEAIRHALSEPDFGKASEFIMLSGYEMLQTGERETLQWWIEQIPEKIVHQYPILCLQYASALISDRNPSNLGEVEKLLDLSEKAIDTNKLNLPSDIKDLITARRLRGLIAVMRAQVSRGRGDPPQKVVDLSKRALAGLKADENEFRAFLNLNLVVANLYTSELDKAMDALEEIWPSVQTCGVSYVLCYAGYFKVWITFLKGSLNDALLICRETLSATRKINKKSDTFLPIAGILYICRATILFEKNKQEEAKKELKKGLKLTRIAKEWNILVSGYALLLQIKRVEKADPDELIELVERIKRIERDMPGVNIYAAGLQIEILLAGVKMNSGNLDIAVETAMKYGLSLDMTEQTLKNHLERRWCLSAQFALIRLMIAQKKNKSRQKPYITFKQINRFLSRQQMIAQEKGLTSALIEVLILQAMVLQVRGEPVEAMIPFEKALVLGEPEKFIRLFVNKEEPVSELLGQAIKNGICVDYAGYLLSIFKKESENTDAPVRKSTENSSIPQLTEKITPRELEVLRLIADGFSNQEIADELFVAKETVKSHIKNIYRKLHVSRRLKAIAAARKYNLL